MTWGHYFSDLARHPSFPDISDSDAKQGLHMHTCADEYASGQSMLISPELWIRSGKNTAVNDYKKCTSMATDE